MRPDRTGPDRIDLTSADDPRDVAHRAVASLAQGGLVVLPTEAGAVLAASVLAPSALDRLRQVKDGLDGRPLSLAVRGPEEIADWVPDVSEVGRKLSRRAWPGPVTLILHGDTSRGLAQRLDPRVREMVAPGESIGLRRPSHRVTREVLDLVPGPVVMTDAPEAALHSPLLEMILDDAPPAPGRNTVVRVDGRGWSVVREGMVETGAIRRMVGTIVLFVCTGNTCRSPMAEALCRLLLAGRLGCKPEELEDRGFVVASAGLAASRGSRAASDAQDVIQARGGTLRGHVSRQVDRPMIAGADLIIAMTRDHRDALLDEFPDAEGRIRLMHPRGGDVADPIGTDRETYRRTAEAMESYIESLLDEMGLA